MSNPWFRLYHEFADDPKVQMMPEHMQRRLIMLFCEQCSDVLATFSEREIAFHWRVGDADVAETKALFIAKGFIDERWNILNWDHRQFISDSSTERTRRYRERRRTSQNSHGDGDVTKCDALEQNRTEQIQNRAEQNRRARVEESGEPGSEDQKDLVGSVGEGLEKLEEPKSSLASQEESDLEKSSDSCDISGNSPHLQPTETLQVADSKDESGYTPVPPIAQQERVEPPTEAKAGQNQPSAVISDADVELIRLAYPKKVGLELARRTIAKQHALLVRGGRLKADGETLPKMTSAEATAYLLARTQAYAISPQGMSDFAPHPGTWFNGGNYTEDESTWRDRHDNSKSGRLGNEGVAAIIQDVLAGGRAEDVAGDAPRMSDDAFRRLRRDSRASSLGPRPGAHHPRHF